MALFRVAKAGAGGLSIDTRNLTPVIDNFGSDAFSDSQSCTAGTYLFIFGGASGGSATLTIGTETPLAFTTTSTQETNAYSFILTETTNVSVTHTSNASRNCIGLYKIA